MINLKAFFSNFCIFAANLLDSELHFDGAADILLSEGLKASSKTLDMSHRFDTVGHLDETSGHQLSLAAHQ